MRGVLVSVDPGKNACGVAVFVDGVLVRAQAVPSGVEGGGPKAWDVMAWDTRYKTKPFWEHFLPVRLVVESMQVRAHGKGDPADLVELSCVVGAVCYAFPSFVDKRTVLAAEWNGQVPSSVREARTKAWVLSQHSFMDDCGCVIVGDWQSVVDLRTTARFQKDVWSAIGIGRWALGLGDRPCSWPPIGGVS